MDVVLGDRTFDDFNIFCFAYLSYKVSQSFCNLSVQNLFSVFGDPHQVVFEVIHGVGCCPVILHIPIVLKSSPKRRGVFSPKGTLNIIKNNEW